MTIDSAGASASGASGAEDAARGAAPARVPAKKPRRPRPTFEDGALTRTYKFPSKTYPRSSYYVTSTEIIIRIKKARKKWKMTIPKKRVVSYRTNRWFAKPRWIAIELTYTQAVKLGLAEARARVEPAPTDVTAANTNAGDASPVLAHTAVAAASSVGPERAENTLAPLEQSADEASSSADPHVAAEDAHAMRLEAEGEAAHDGDEVDVDISAEQDGLEHFELALDTDEGDAQDEAEAEFEAEQDMDALAASGADKPDDADTSLALLASTPAPPPAAAAAEAAPAMADMPQEAPRASAEVIPFVPPPLPPPASATHALARVAVPAAAPMAPRRRSSIRPAFATLAAALAGYALWAAFDTTAMRPEPRCTAAECGTPIVTGAIGPADAPGAAAAIEAEPPLSASQVAAVARSELAEQSREESDAASVAVPEDKPNVVVVEPPAREMVAIVLPERELVLPLSPPLVTASVEVPKPSVAPPPACSTLPARAREMQITFDYARSRLDAGALPGLDELAALLRDCKDTNVLIEGHTDSDGRAANNRSLSLRRAEAVRKHLVAAGVDAHRVEAVGFGQTRPAFPNVSQKNKRSNRRVVLVVTAPR